MLAIFGGRRPNHGCAGVEDCISPHLNVEPEPICTDVADACPETPVFAAIEIDEVEEDDLEVASVIEDVSDLCPKLYKYSDQGFCPYQVHLGRSPFTGD